MRVLYVVGDCGSGRLLSLATKKALSELDYDVITFVDEPQPKSPFLNEIPLFNLNEFINEKTYVDLESYEKPSVIFTPKRGRKKGGKRKR